MDKKEAADTVHIDIIVALVVYNPFHPHLRHITDALTKERLM